MKINFTQNLILLLTFCLSGGLLLLAPHGLYAQGNATPVYEVDLTGKPNGEWVSPDVNRKGLLCDADGKNNENCVQFNIILDRNAGGLEFDIVEGPVPSGSMAYKIDCGTPVPVGEPICVTGTGPHKLTLCMPGNAKNKFVVRSIAAFNPQPDISVTAGCSATLYAPIAFEEASITWTDLTGGGKYLSYLSFPNGNANPIVTPDDNPPAYVDYQVCGRSVASPCSTLPYCDVVRVYFYPPPVVTIGPQPAIICPGGSGVVLTGTVTGGDGEFEYIWTNAAGSVVGRQRSYTATAVGAYKLEVRNQNYPNCREFSASVNVVSNLTVNAGPDQLACAQNPVQLAGAVTAATGGIWSGGGGTFSPSNTAFNAVYTPTAGEISAGSVRLTLTSTGNGSCSPVKDDVLLTFYSMNVSLSGTAVVCGGATGSVSASVTGGQAPVTYKWSSGETTASITGKPAGTYTVTVSDGQSCAVQKSFTITEKPGPSDFMASLSNTTCGASNGSITVSGVTGGTAPYTYSKDGTTFQTSATFAGLAVGQHTITVKDASGCSVVKAFTLTNIAGPTAVAASATAASCANNDGSITVGGVTGGTAPYTYSVNGTSFQSSTAFTGLASGAYTLTAKDANGCIVTSSVSVSKTAPTGFTATTNASTCGASNGSVVVSGVTGGVSPYTYSKDGATFQTSATLTGLAAGTHTITVKDAKGCIFAKPVTVANIAGPSDLTANTKPATCGASNGEFTVSGVTGGTAPYTYSINGTSFQTAATFTALAEGSYTATVKDANGCTFAKTVTVANIAGPNFTLSAKAATCGGNNGSVTVSGVTGGVSPYTYSKNGTTFQASATFTGLAEGTYTITVKDANGCMLAKDAAVANIPGPSNINLTATASTCGGSNGSITAGTVSGGTAPYTYSLNNGSFQSAATYGGLVKGTYTLTVKDANNCTFSKTVALDDIPGPTNLTATAKAATCGGSNGEVTVSAVSGGTAPYSYSKNGTTFQTSATLTGFAAGTHTITVKDANGCAFAKTVTVTNIAGPTAVTASATPASCANNDGTVTAGAVTGGTAPYAYSINGTTFQAGTTFSGLAFGSYTLMAKDANGCTVTTSVSVGKNVPTAFASTSVAATCGGSNGEVRVTGVTGGTAPYTYSKGGTAFQASATLTGLAAGTHTITVKDANGCTYAKAVTVSNINGPSDLTAIAKASTCGNSNGEFTVSGVTGGVAPYTYSINGTSFQASATFTGLAEGAYTITVKDANGCTYNEQVALTNIAGPSFTLSAQAATCGNSNGRVVVNGVTGGTSPYTYSKDGTTFQTSTSFTGLEEGTYTITVKDANGCMLAKTVEVVNIPGPSDMALAGKSSTCGAANGTVTVGSVTGGTAPYTYAVDGGSYQAATSFASVLAGEHTVTVKDANGCTFSKKITIDNIPGPTNLAATTTAATCGENNGTLTVGTVTGGTAPYTYSKDGVNFQAATAFAGVAPGTHTITVKDANGCTFAKSFTVASVAGPSAVAASSTPATCADNDGSISVGAVTSGTAPYTYSINGATFKSGTNFNSLASGDYTVTVKDANGCTVTTSVSVGKNVPTSFASNTVPANCGRSDGQLTVSSVTGGTAPYTYAVNSTSFQASATFTGLAAGNHTVTVKDANGCTFTSEVAVRNVEGPSFSASAKASTCGSTNGSISVSNVTGGVGPYTYSVDGVNFQAAATFSNLLANTYTVTVKDAKGCLGTTTVVVEDIAGPSAITLKGTSSTCGGPNAQVGVSEVSGGTAPYTYSKDGTNFQTSATFTGLMAGTHTITVKDANSCIVTETIEIENIAGPSDILLTSKSSTCGAANGTVTVNGVTGGAAPYTYALDGGSYQPSTTFASVLAGEHTVSVKDANGCTFSGKITVENIAGPSDLTATTKSATCGASNGELTVTGVTGGTAPYTYSKGGTDFQASATFTELAAGSHAITVKDANGCTFVKNITVSNIGGPTAIASTSKAATCADNDGSITITGVTGGTAPYTYAVDGRTFQAVTTFAALPSGAYTVTARDAKGCTFTVDVKVEKEGPADFAYSVGSSSCGSSNGSIRVTAVEGGATPYTYALNGGAYQGAATFSNLAAGTYRVSVKDANGCAYTKEVQVNDVGGPTDVLAAVRSATCSTSNGQINVSAVTEGKAPYAYAINGTDFQSSTSFTGLMPGEYLLTVKDANGCIFAKSFEVPDAPGPADFAMETKQATCGESNGEVTVYGIISGTAPYTYSADGTNFQAAETLAGLAPGQHTITVKDANGCTFVKQVVIENIPGPSNYTLAAVATTCGDANGKITVSGITGGTAPYTYALNGGSFQVAAEFTAVVAGEHTITVKDANGCTLVKQVKVNNIAGPEDMAAVTTPSACTVNNGTIKVNSITGGTAPYTYSLDGKTFQPGATFSGLAPMEYKVHVKDANGCSAIFKATVGSKGPKEGVTAATIATCGEDNGSITVTSVSGGTLPLAYSLDGGITFQTSATFSNLAAGSYTILVKDAEGCTLELTESVGNSGGATFSVAGTDASCGGENGKIVISQVSGGQSPYTYSVDGKTFQASPEFTGLAEGTYQVAVKDAAGCLGFQSVVIGNSPPITDLRATTKPAGCDQGGGQVTVEEVAGGTAPYTYSLDGTNFSGAATLTGVAAGNYTLTVKDARGCTYTIPVTVDGYSSKLAYVTNLSCTGEATGVIAFTSNKKGAQPEFSIDNGVTFQKDSVFTNLPKGVYQLVTRFSESCTIAVGTAEVKEANPVQVVVTPLTKAVGLEKSGSAAVTSISGGTGPYTYAVDGGGFSADSVFTKLGAGTHTLVVSDSFGCIAELTFEIEGFHDIDIPNGFTPNGDGINDKWALKNLAELYPNCSVTVYNRWGSPVFKSRGYTRPWDGTFNGKRLPDGTYYCIIEFGDGSAPLKQSVTIMR